MLGSNIKSCNTFISFTICILEGCALKDVPNTTMHSTKLKDDKYEFLIQVLTHDMLAASNFD
jgi:hypothetical protein